MANYQKIAQAVARKYWDYPGLIGILWIGSSTFGLADKQTDIDIRLIVDRRNKLYPMKQSVKDTVDIEVDEMSWQWLTEDLNPDSDQRWIREKSVILYDPQNQISRKFNELSQLIAEQTKTQLWKYFKDAFYSNEIEKCSRRRDQETTNLYFYKAVDSILKFIFLYHNQPPPPFKWRWHFVNKDKLLSVKAVKTIKDILTANNSLAEKLKLLVVLEKYLQQLMLKKGFRKEMVEEHWRF